MKRLFAILIFSLSVCSAWAAPTRTLNEGIFTVEFAAEDEDAAKRTLSILQEAGNEFGKALPVGGAPIRVVICPTYTSFMKYAKRFLPGQVVGIADPRQGLIAVQSPRMREIRTGFGDTLRHELVHILLERNVNTAYLPQWLNEGLAMFLAREHEFATPITIAMMFFGNRLIPYKDIDRAFMMPGQEQEFGDAYAQALSMTRHMYGRLGKEKFWKVVLATREMPFADALREHAGISVYDFWDSFHRSLWLIALIGALASGSFFGPMAVLSIVAYFSVRRRNRQKLDQWEEEEALDRADAGKPPIMSWEEALDDDTTYVPGIDDEDDDEVFR